VAIRYGAFINACISFLIIALVVYLISKMFIKEAEPDPTKECPFCFEANHPSATKCKACASAI
jgi:large conductance mechanosensitive channel